MIKLSYIITTYNKLPFLKEVIGHLLKHVETDEEIVVTDGGSTDGTVDYLNDLFKEKKIQQYISEKDKGEAHGFNKAIFMSSGEIIKIITDDDAFYYPVVKACKHFMLAHNAVDVLGGNSGNIYVNDLQTLGYSEDFEADYIRWKNGKMKNFFFNGTCLMLRKSSLPLTGIFDANSLLTDLEFTLRITSNANLAWCKGLMSVRILNDQSNNLRFAERSKLEDEKLCNYYNFRHAHVRREEARQNRSLYLKTRSKISDVKIKLLIRKEKALPKDPKENSFAEVHKHCLNWMLNHELNKEITFYTKG